MPGTRRHCHLIPLSALLGLWLWAPALMAGEWIIARFDQLTAAESLQESLRLRGKQVELRDERYIIELKTLSIGYFTRRADAEALQQQLAQQKIETFVRNHKDGIGFIVHAGAMEDDHNFWVRYENLLELGYYDMVIGYVPSVRHRYFLVEVRDEGRPLLQSVIPLEGLSATPLAAEARFLGWQSLSETGSANLLHLGGGLQWQKDDRWRLRAGFRLYASEYSGTTASHEVTGDYDEIYLGYGAEDNQWLLGALNQPWREPSLFPTHLGSFNRALDPQSAVTSTPNQPVASLAWRFRGPVYTVQAVWQPRLRPDRLPADGVLWHPVDRVNGRIQGQRLDSPLSDLVKQGLFQFSDDHSSDSFGLRLGRGKGRHYQLFSLEQAASSRPYFRPTDSVLAQLAAGVPAATIGAGAGPHWQASHPRLWRLALEEGGPRARFGAAITTGLPTLSRDYRLLQSDQMSWALSWRDRWQGSRIRYTFRGDHLTLDDALLAPRHRVSLGLETKRNLQGIQFRGVGHIGLTLPELQILAEARHRLLADNWIFARGMLFFGSDGSDGGFYSGKAFLALGWQGRI